MEFLDTLIGPDSDQIKWWQMGVRGVFVFLLAILLVRFGDRRIFGKSSAFDIVLGIILGSILSRAITGNSPFYQTIFTTLLLVALHWLFAYLSFRVKNFGYWVKGGKTDLMKEGKLLETNMRKFNITYHDICEACRKNNIAEIEDVKEAFLERSGDISLIAFEKKG